MLTYQDFEKATDRAEFIAKLIAEHEASAEVRTAREADEYAAQRNITINEYAKVLYTLDGRKVADFTASNNKIASNYFYNLNTRRCNYSLGNGVEFSRENVKDKLGLKFDTRLKEAAFAALIHGRSFVFWNFDRVHVFKLTEFAPLEDEYEGNLRAGVRYYQIAEDKPMTAVLYEEDGYTVYRREKGKPFAVHEEKRAYKRTSQKARADAEVVVVSEENYSALPIVPLYGSSIRQSTLVGMRGAIDAFDLIRSGFANDLEDCAQVYWILKNYNGMNDSDLAKFRDRLKLTHIATADTGDGGEVTAHTQEVPYAARKAFLDEIRAGIYEDFGILDVKTLSAAATNDHIDAGYQAQDDYADDFEYQIIECVQQILALQGIEDTPQFKRGRISNRKEQVEILSMEAAMVDLPDEVLLKQFPNFTPEQVAEALEAIMESGAQRMTRTEQETEDEEDTPQESET